jgi:cystathionine beta-lyase/cystathionine gamma-synthase
VEALGNGLVRVRASTGGRAVAITFGIPEGLVRYSAGIEDADDLVAELDRVLATL